MVKKGRSQKEEELKTFLRKNQQSLLNKPGVTSVGIGHKIKGGKQTDELCIQVITPGYEVTVQAQGSLRTYRTNGAGSVIRREK